MKLSPVQLLESHPIKVCVEYNSKLTVDESAENEEVELAIEHMTHIERIGEEDLSGDKAKYPTYVLVLGIRSGDETTTNPYSFEIVVTGLFSIDPDALLTGTSVDDMATQYGFSMLYGQIRDILMSISGRMKSGLFVLPTMSFMDAKFPVKALGGSAS